MFCVDCSIECNELMRVRHVVKVLQSHAHRTETGTFRIRCALNTMSQKCTAGEDSLALNSSVVCRDVSWSRGLNATSFARTHRKSRVLQVTDEEQKTVRGLRAVPHRQLRGVSRVQLGRFHIRGRACARVLKGGGGNATELLRLQSYARNPAPREMCI